MNKKFSGLYINEEWWDGFQIIETEWDRNGICKRCAKPFIKKRRKQIFCSKQCASLYKIKMNKMKEKYRKEFNDWLNDEIDYSYAPERF